MIEYVFILSIFAGVIVAAFVTAAAIYSLGLQRVSAILAVLTALAVSALFDLPTITATSAALFILMSLAAAFPLIVRSPRFLQGAVISVLALGATLTLVFLSSAVSNFYSADPRFGDDALVGIEAFDAQTADGRVARFHTVYVDPSILNVVDVAFGFAVVWSVLSGFALGVFRAHRPAWARQLFMACASLVIMFVLGLYLGASFQNLVLYVVLYQFALALALFGIFLQIGASVRRRLEVQALPKRAVLDVGAKPVSAA